MRHAKIVVGGDVSKHLLVPIELIGEDIYRLLDECHLHVVT